MQHEHARYVRRLIAAFGLAALLAPAGCVSPLPTGYSSGSRRAESAEAASTDETGGRTPEDSGKGRSQSAGAESAALRKAEGAQQANEAEALASILDELQAIRAIDPQAEAQLMADLKEAKPEFYPLIVQQFRAALDYRRQLAERNSTSEPRDLQVAAASDPEAVRERTAAPPKPSALSNVERTADDGLTSGVDPAVTILPPPATREADSLPQAVIASDSLVQAASYSQAKPPATRTSPKASAPATGDWHAQLESTIETLQSRISDQPASVDELHDHMRLRALELLAGRSEDAYRPIPGASPAVQDYWSKQLFAIDAYLDAQQGVDEKQRAAGALVHLDQARSRLAELATLQLRNLTFVESVDGFGSYKPLDEAKFRPGQRVTVYAEVENFRSDSTPDGYRTTLGTSYQVVDESGHRVEGFQFPEVADLCRNRRRDFHMQYDLAMPTQIYPGKYRLELTVTDQRSNKIGTANLPLEIVGVSTATR
jgi:hypothetical protein